MRVTFTVNGRRQEADDVWEGESLLYVLRERLGLPGSKNACEQGECGSCTVRLDGVPVCSCLVAAGQAQDREVTHRRGAGRRRTANLTPVQQAFVDAGAVQCGFCTPGLLVAADELLEREPAAHRRRHPRGAVRQPVPLHRLREDPRRGPARRRPHAASGGGRERHGHHPARPTGLTQGARTAGGIGESTLRPDGTLKVTGEFAYSSDLWHEDMLWGHTLRSTARPRRDPVHRHRRGAGPARRATRS